MRLAYLGPLPDPISGGAAGAAWVLIRELCRDGCHIDVYHLTSPNFSVPEGLAELEGLHLHSEYSGWRWGRWYSRNPMLSTISGQIARALGRFRLARALRSRHSRQPYDVLLQFSTIETFGLSRVGRLPPLVVYPSVHVAGELRSLRDEWSMAIRADGQLRPRVIRLWFTIRAARQRRDIARAAMVIALSKRFAQLLHQDYGVPRDRLCVVPHAINLDRFSSSLHVVGGPSKATKPEPVGTDDGSSAASQRIAVVGRIALRKGIEDVVELSHRLADLAGTARIEIVGSSSLWSDYRPLLRDLNPETSTYLGQMAPGELAKWLPDADLLVQPSHYEPFALTVAEALATGVPVVASEEVGAAEEVPETCCTRTRPGDVDALESAVRVMLDRMRSPDSTSIRESARHAAEHLFAPERAAIEVRRVLEAARQHSRRGSTQT